MYEEKTFEEMALVSYKEAVAVDSKKKSFVPRIIRRIADIFSEGNTVAEYEDVADIVDDATFMDVIELVIDGLKTLGFNVSDEIRPDFAVELAA